MYCPRCGQQQISDDMKFCSRCGLPISELTEWLAGGNIPARRVEEPQATVASPRRKGMRRGAKLMFLSGVLSPIFFLISIAADGAEPMVVPLLVFFMGLSLFLYSRLFGEEIPTVKGQQSRPSELGAMSGGGALPPASNLRTHGVGGQAVRTKELAQPPSVTEHTTRLLGEE